jgi:hypothetical protein
VAAVGTGATAEKFFKGEAGVALGAVAVFLGDGERFVILFDVQRLGL